MTDLAGKTILLTGASTGIGAAAARVLGSSGAHLVAHYATNQSGAQASTAGIPADRKRLIQADFTAPDAADQLWHDAVAWRGRIDVLVNNAAVLLWGGGIDSSDPEWNHAWNRSYQVNVLAPARLLRHAVRHFRERGGGIIVTMSSWVGQRGSALPDLTAYAASKAAVRAATQTIARAYARDNILAYIVSPGVVRTKMSEDAAARQGGEAAVTASLAMGEWVPPDDLAELVAFLASGRCRHLTGATIDVNGASYTR
jgi:NAD(P)-dependent dehydrogenase (short-subunit alcohol dehydrogenase family)